MSGYADIKKFRNLKDELIRNDARESYNAGVPPDQIEVKLGTEHADKLFSQAKRGGISSKEERELASEAFNQKPDKQYVKLVGDPGAAYDAAENFRIRVNPTQDYRDALVAHLTASLGADKIDGLKSGHIKSTRKASREFAKRPSKKQLETLWRLTHPGSLGRPGASLTTAWENGGLISDVPPAGKVRG